MASGINSLSCIPNTKPCRTVIDDSFPVWFNPISISLEFDLHTSASAVSPPWLNTWKVEAFKHFDHVHLLPVKDINPNLFQCCRSSNMANVIERNVADALSRWRLISLWDDDVRHVQCVLFWDFIMWHDWKNNPIISILLAYPPKRPCLHVYLQCFLRGARRSVPRRKWNIEKTAPHSHTEPRALAKSLDKFIHYNQAVGHDAWQGLPKDYNIFTPLGFHHMVDQISVTGDQCAALPQGHKHNCDRFDKEPKSVWQLNTNRCLATMWMLNQRYRVWHQGVLPRCFSPITYHRAESEVIRGSGRNIDR